MGNRCPYADQTSLLESALAMTSGSGPESSLAGFGDKLWGKAPRLSGYALGSLAQISSSEEDSSPPRIVGQKRHENRRACRR
jgi:hypothetical protein